MEEGASFLCLLCVICLHIHICVSTSVVRRPLFVHPRCASHHSHTRRKGDSMLWRASATTISRPPVAARTQPVGILRRLRRSWGKDGEGGGQIYRYDMDAYRRGFVNAREVSPCQLNGTVPADIKGTYFRNGHGKFQIGEDLVLHPFDGDGMVAAITFSNGRAYFRSQYVKTKGYVTEQREGRICFRGVFGTAKRGGWLRSFLDLRVKNVANTGVLWWNRKLLALWEQGRPYALDPISLSTLRESSLNGLLKRGGVMAAHYKVDPKTNRLVAFGCQIRPVSSKVSVWEFDPSFKLLKQRSFRMPGLAFLHDFAITDNYYLFIQPPLSLHPLPWLLGKCGIGQALSFHPDRPARLYIVPRNRQQQRQPHTTKGGRRWLGWASCVWVALGVWMAKGRRRERADGIRCLDLDPFFIFHFANAYEEDNGNLVIDIDRSERYTFDLTLQTPTNPHPIPKHTPIWLFDQVEKKIPKIELFRYRITTSGSGRPLAFDKRPLLKRFTEFPIINPANVGQRYRYVYGLAGGDPSESAPLQGILKLDVETKEAAYWFPDAHEFCGEPCFIPTKTSPRETHLYHPSDPPPSSATQPPLLKAGARRNGRRSSGLFYSASVSPAVPTLTHTRLVERGRVGREQGEGGGYGHGEEDEGYLLSLLFNGKNMTSEVVLFDAQSVSSGPIARLPLPSFVPHGLHGTFCPDADFAMTQASGGEVVSEHYSKTEWRRVLGFAWLYITSLAKAAPLPH